MSLKDMDWENLDGKFICYAEFIAPINMIVNVCENNSLYSLEYIVAKIFQKENEEKTVEEIRNMIEENKDNNFFICVDFTIDTIFFEEKIKKYLKKNKKTVFKTKNFSDCFSEEGVNKVFLYTSLLTKEDLEKKSEDLLYVGKFSNPKIMMDSIDFGFFIYLRNYFEQTIRKIEQQQIKEDFLQSKIIEEVSETDHYKNYNDIFELKKKVIDYVGKLVQQEKWSYEFKKIENDFSCFFKGFDVQYISEIMDEIKNEADFNLINLYTEKIVSMAFEDFKYTQKISNQIQDMKSKK